MEYALEQNAVILFDAAYEAFIRGNRLVAAKVDSGSMACLLSAPIKRSRADILPLFSIFRISRRIGSARAFNVCCSPISQPTFNI